MSYADLKNDYVFHKVFGGHPEALRGLLNDILDRAGEDEIKSLEYLVGEQLPLVFGQKLSILDLRCRAQSGEVFVVEMQVLHVAGFLNRVIYNACKAYVATLLRGRPYGTLTNVIAVSICNFELWTDADQRARGQAPIPMVSRWRMAERASGAESLGQVQCVFLELPKLGDRALTNAVERWAAIFIAAPMLDEAHMAKEPLTDAQREALESAREESFTAAERDAIERAHEEVDQVRRSVEQARTEGLAAGIATGIAPLLRLFQRKLMRELTELERTTLMTRLVAFGPERLGDVVLDLDGEALAAWIAETGER